MATVKKVKKYQNAPKPIPRPSIPDSSKTKGSGLKGFDPYGDNKSKDGIGIGGLKKPKIETPAIITGFKKQYSGGKVSKAQVGSTIKRKTAGGEYKTKITTDKTGAVTKIKDRRTLKGFLKGAPKGRGVITPEPVISAPEAKDGKWIQKAIKKPGALRKSLGAKKGEPIPAGKLAAAAKKPGKLGQRARLAQTLKKMKKK